ncbi:MAG: gliding motility protein GldC [Cytophagaceae bacterium]
MKKSEIKFIIELDEQNVPNKIVWDATDSPHGKAEEAKAIALSIWDQTQQQTMRIDLWAKDMPVVEMKRFFIETIGGMAETIKSATDDNIMAEKMHELCKELVKHVETEHKL